MPTKKPAESVEDLERNDLAGAIAYVAERKRLGKPITPETWRVLSLLQDDAGVALDLELERLGLLPPLPPTAPSA